MSTGYILIVDDTPANIEVVSEILADAGFEFASVLSGERALSHTQHGDPDLILLDVMMPGIDGFETCQQLKANPKTQNIPIIFMTALADVDSKVKGFELGAVDYITKPFQEREVLARVQTHLRLSGFTKTLEQQVTERTTQLSQALQDLQTSQLQLIQSEKMSALGQLVAGIGHEINNPLGCIYGNVEHVEAYLKDLIETIELYEQHYPTPVNAIAQKLEEIDLDFLREDLPKIINALQESTLRIRQISTSLRTFSRDDCDRPVRCDLHAGIDSTLLILRHRLKTTESRPSIAIVKDYGTLPEIECYAGQLNQVLMNLFANAIDAIEETDPSTAHQIMIQTVLTADQRSVTIRIKDTGIGMSAAVQQRAFDHLFTTKELGKGTGLGLAIARSIIVEKHNGTLEVNSAIGQGTEFVITIPVQQSSCAPAN